MQLRALDFCVAAFFTAAVSACGTAAAPAAVEDVAADWQNADATAVDVAGADSVADAAVAADAAALNLPTGFTEECAYVGPHAVGHVDFEVTDPARNRLLRMTIWYPADPSAKAAAANGTPIAEFEPEGPRRKTIADLAAKAPAACAQVVTHSARDAQPLAGGLWPLVAYSHCHSCMRYSAFTLAQRLASQGFAVLAPDHTGNTLIEGLAGKSAPLDSVFLATRALDIRFALDVALDPNHPALPQNLRGRFDANKVAMFGHSFGGVTTGKVLQDDARLKAGLAIAVPMANPLLQGVDMAKIAQPVAFILAEEDNSITAAGNAFIEQNYADAKNTAWLWRVADAGHFSFSDIAGLSFFTQGCGKDKRMTDDTPFTYLDNHVARCIGARYLSAFMRFHLLGDATATAILNAATPSGVVQQQHKP